MNSRVEHSILAASLATPEEGVGKPGRTRPASAITQIAALKPGEHWARVATPPAGMPLKDFAAESGEMREALRNLVNSSLRHAKAKTGGTYSVETGDFISSNRTLYLVCVVTRLE